MTAREGWLLGGRVRHDQLADGHRSGIEPVLLAASIPARPGARVLEGGTGAGAALLCLAARVAGIGGVGLERDAAQAALARRNIAANGFGGLAVMEGDIAALRPEGVFDHAFANPTSARYDEADAKLAWERTTGFLARHLPVAKA